MIDKNTVQISVDEIAQDLTIYLQRVEAGKTLVIVRSDKPLAEIKPVSSTAQLVRPFGLCAGEFVVPYDFDAPLPEHIVQ